MPSLISKHPRTARGAPDRLSRVDLTIGRNTYALQGLAEVLDPGARAFRLVKRDGTIYDVASTSFGPTCDCPDYIFRREGLDPSGCKHIKALVGSGLFGPGRDDP